jgi:hypothetical protein
MTHRGGKRNIYRIFVVKSEGRRAIARPRHRWEDNIKMDHKEIRRALIRFIKLRIERICGFL